MRVLWSVFITFPEVAPLVDRKAEYACTWARALAYQFKKRTDIQLAITSVYSGQEVQKYEVDNVVFYFIPNEKQVKKNGGGEKARSHWAEIISDFKPDIVHIHGSESMVSFELTQLDLKIPVFLSLQGIISNYWKDEYAGLGLRELVLNTSIRDVVRWSGIILDRQKTKNKSKLEKKLLQNIRYVGGRTTWDRVSSLALNPSLKYMYAPEMIRQEFYDTNRWNIQKVKKHRIFMHQGFKPIKGLHVLLEAIHILKPTYPDIELYMSGTNIMKNRTLKERLLQPGYVKYLFKKIKQYGLEKCIHFTGVLDANQIIEELKKSHVMVIPSTIENSPNSLVEAQLVGIPCVASHVGGVPEMITHNEDGFLYTFNEPYMLAEYIKRLFETDDLCDSFSTSSYKKIREQQGVDLVLTKTLENYKYLIDNYKRK
ncbi:MAG: glycosyltransferase [Polaribacter sp.]|nr:glycosyltransferase [Polaribacter sp.]